MTDGTGIAGEAGRLAALQRYQILDTGPEKAFDDLTFLASHVCNAPITYLSLIDADRQWFKSKIGLAVSEVPRHDGFAAHALTQTDIFVVADVTQDKRFASSPLVAAEPSVCFYAAAPLVTHDGHVIGTLSVADRVARDLSFEQKEALRALSRQAVVQLELRRQLVEREADTLEGGRNLVRSLLDHFPDLIYVKDTDGRYVLSNLAYVRFLGARSVAEVRGNTVFDLFPPEVARQHDADDQAIMRSGKPLLNHEELTVNPAGERIWMSTTKIPLWDSHGKVLGLVVIARDITEHKRAAEALRHSEELHRTLADNSAVGIWHVTNDGRTIHANPAMCALLGLDSSAELEEKTSHAFLTAETVAQIERDLVRRDANTPATCEIELTDKRGTKRRLMVAGAPLHDAEGKPVSFIGTFTDITERARLEERLQQTQKIDAVGRLAGGVAHDFNNLLTAILGYSEMLLRRQQLDSTARRHTEEIRKAAERGAALTQQLLAFSRKQTMRPHVLDLNAVVADMDKLLRRLISENIKVITVPGSKLGCVRADPSQLEQVILNVVINASDAMPNGGTLTIETGEATLDEEYVRHHAELKPGRYVLLAISDTGVGMSLEAKAHLFEPFYTTKSVGKGTGLGLATCYGIVKQSGGHINVYSELGRGTTVKVYLPCVHQPAEPVHPPHEQSGELPRGHETILVVEDEPTIRELAVHVLRELGYMVLQAADGEEALRVSRQHHGKIELLVSDVIMPQMGASELVALLAPLRPKMKVLYVSGYTDLAVTTNLAVTNDHGLIGPGRAFLQKPFTPSLLAHAVRQVLDGKNHR
jgi:two-component system, cell cycle sensor histidine kinase and response regulator CckA